MAANFAWLGLAVGVVLSFALNEWTFSPFAALAMGVAGAIIAAGLLNKDIKERRQARVVLIGWGVVIISSFVFHYSFS